MTPTILVAASSQSLRRTLHALLGEARYAVLEAEDGESALGQLIGTPGVSLLLTELGLRTVDGLQLTRRVRALPGYQFLPILVVSADASPAHEAEGLAAGVTGWFSQPVQAAQVLEVVGRLLA